MSPPTKLVLNRHSCQSVSHMLIFKTCLHAFTRNSISSEIHHSSTVLLYTAVVLLRIVPCDYKGLPSSAMIMPLGHWLYSFRLLNRNIQTGVHDSNYNSTILSKSNKCTSYPCRLVTSWYFIINTFT